MNNPAAGSAPLSFSRSPYAPEKLSTWWIAMRPFSLPASAMPVAFGTAAAAVVTGAPLRPGYFLLALAGMMLLHGSANIINDIYDFRRGIDREVLPISGAVVRCLLSEKQAALGASVMILAGSLIGLYLAWKVTWLLLPLGLFGVAVGVFYSVDPLGLKYRALGDLCVFIDFGILGSLGAWMVQTGNFSWLPVIWSVPQSLLVIAILHANNWRDIQGDNKGGFSTVASLLGDRASQRYYGFLLTAPFVLMLLYMIVPRAAGVLVPLPFTFFLVFFALPPVLKLWRKARERGTAESPLDFATLDGATGQLNLVFGLLSILAFGLHLVF